MPPRYTSTAIWLHWLIALLILGTAGLGLYMVDLKLSPWKLKLYSWHKWIGVTIRLLVLVRIVWRATHRPPHPPPMPAWQKGASTVSHMLLYVLMAVIPLTGWLFSSASGFPVVYLGVIQLPDLVAKNKELAELFQMWHAYLNYTLLAVVAVHVLAALKHHLDEADQLTLLQVGRFKYSAYVTNLNLKAGNVWRTYHARANVEKSIRELLYHLALNKIPTQEWTTNVAFFQMLLFAYNLVHWFKRLCLPGNYFTATVETIRSDFFVLPGKFTCRAGPNVLQLPRDYHYREIFLKAAKKIANLRIAPVATAK